MSQATTSANKIVANLKGLRNHLQVDEQPLLTIPGIWDGGQEQHSTACDIVLTNQRLFGYYFVSFPRERLFLDGLPLSNITTVSLRQKSFEPLFRELLISDGQRKIYIRAPRKKLETLYEGLRSTTTHKDTNPDTATESKDTNSSPTPIYGRQEIRRPFESSPLAIALLFVGGLILEIIGATLWITTQSPAAGLPPCIAGLLAVFFSIMVRRQRSP